MAGSNGTPAGALRHFLGDMREGWRRMSNVVFALIFRELKTRSGGSDSYGMHGLIGILIEPAVGVAAMSVFWYILRRSEIGGVHVALFLTVSMTAFAIIRRSLASVPRTIRATRAFYAFPNVKPFDAVLARFTLELVLTTLGGALLLFLLWWFMGLEIKGDGLISAMRVYALLAIFGFGLSLIVGVYGTRFPFILKAIQLFSRGLLFISAVMHPVAELTPEAEYVIAWNPVAHAIEFLRLYLLGSAAFPDASEYFLFICAMSSISLGFVAYWVNRLKVLER